MPSNEEAVEEANGDSFLAVKQRLRDRSKVRRVLLSFYFLGSVLEALLVVCLNWVCLVLQKVAQTKEMLSKQAVQTKEILSKQAVKIAKQAEEHERFINKAGFFFFAFICLQWLN